MWLTGFDAPSFSTVYLDKPMRNHTLMQTIARANRVFPGIEDTLDTDLPRAYTPALYNQKCAAVFEHVYES